MEAVGGALGEEARTKRAHVLLGPTVNMHRSPLGGRHFEGYSEDPLLAARTAAAYVRGVQSRGVAACVKHFVANDSEFERMTISSELDARTLRELYLPPFEAAVREAGAWALMTAYNGVNGPTCSAHAALLIDLLRDEWGFDGVVMSDWYGTKDTVASARNGLDLEMPGPPRFFGAAARRRRASAARSSRRCSTRRCGGCSASSRGPARSTSPRSLCPRRRSTAPTTARSPARLRRVDRAAAERGRRAAAAARGAAAARRDRPERAPHHAPGRRQRARLAALPDERAGRAPRGARERGRGRLRGGLHELPPPARARRRRARAGDLREHGPLGHVHRRAPRPPAGLHLARLRRARPERAAFLGAPQRRARARERGPPPLLAHLRRARAALRRRRSSWWTAGRRPSPATPTSASATPR